MGSLVGAGWALVLKPVVMWFGVARGVALGLWRCGLEDVPGLAYEPAESPTRTTAAEGAELGTPGMAPAVSQEAANGYSAWSAAFVEVRPLGLEPRTCGRGTCPAGSFEFVGQTVSSD